VIDVQIFLFFVQMAILFVGVGNVWVAPLQVPRFAVNRML
jgi:hypothetical protein